MLRPAPDSIALEERLGALPRSHVSLRARVAVHWDEHQIPFLEAEHDEDLAVALGVVHAHLRWTQMELMRRIALGRLAETIGPPGVRIDQAMRALGLARIAAAIAAMLPQETARWLGGFVAGINHVVAHAPDPGPEFRLLNIAREPWRVEDVLALGRLAAADVTWLSLLPLLRERDRALAAELWRRIVGNAPAHEFAGAQRSRRRAARAPDFLPWFWRGCGSNSVAVARSRSAAGGALMASDPHLPVMLPNPFLLAGYRSPSFHCVGLMIAGLPFMALGRNPWIAWGGTNLHAASSDLFDVSAVPARQRTRRRERIRVRWWFDRRVTITEVDGVPVVSRLSLLRGTRGDCALRWVGAIPSDEFTAMLGVNRARDWDEFRAALRSFAVPGQCLTYADVAGRVGKVAAAHLPRRPVAPPPSPILPPSAAVHWQSFITADDLPTAFDPAAGFVASANERPPEAPVRVGYVFSSDSRILRLRQRLATATAVSFDDLAELQQDVLAPGAPALRDDLVRLLGADATAPAARLVAALASWDGRYDAASRGALAFELLLFHLARALMGPRRLALYVATWNEWDLVRADLAAALPEALARAVRRAAPVAARKLERYGTWGGMHRLRLRHFIGRIPVLGRRYRFGDWPLAGGSETVLKTAHRLAGRRHAVGLAPVARHISDLADPDRNFFVLLGGQDGRVGSTTALDQVALWRSGRYVRIPLSVAAMRRQFRFRVDLSP
ncbi:MAG TPA: penicillin acylase family protein [Stellaceae bacterium]|nr:penicillin acylase family protein [Stellaceae bacterium]